MALQALHEIYWPGDGVVNEDPAPTGGYMWGSVITAGCWLLMALTGAPLPLAMATVDQARRERPFVARLVKRCWQWSTPYRRQVPDRWWLLLRVVRVLWSPEFERARLAVRDVAATPGMREKAMWSEVFRRANRVPGIGENVVRHLHAAESYGDSPARQGHVRDTALQLAYLALKER